MHYRPRIWFRLKDCRTRLAQNLQIQRILMSEYIPNVFIIWRRIKTYVGILANNAQHFKSVDIGQSYCDPLELCNLSASRTNKKLAGFIARSLKYYPDTTGGFSWDFLEQDWGSTSSNTELTPTLIQKVPVLGAGPRLGRSLENQSKRKSDEVYEPDRLCRVYPVAKLRMYGKFLSCSHPILFVKLPCTKDLS